MTDDASPTPPSGGQALARPRKHEKRLLPVGPNPYPPLVIKYGLLAVYGMSSSYVGVLTLQVVSGDIWATLWPLFVATAALGALAGAIRSWVSDHYLLEIVSTILLVALLAGYSLAIILRTFSDGEVERLPVAILPLVVSTFPVAELFRIATKK